MKLVVIIILLVIIVSLFSAAFYLIKGDNPDKLVRALIWRVALSIFLMTTLAIGYYMGLIVPNNPPF
jgi:uncharacterized BrkB/YihY/UPF0761 family membrane protein